jgi:hypothetical protein
VFRIQHNNALLNLHIKAVKIMQVPVFHVFIMKCVFGSGVFRPVEDRRLIHVNPHVGSEKEILSFFLPPRPSGGV